MRFRPSVLLILFLVAALVSPGCEYFMPRRSGIKHYVRGELLAEQGDLDAALAELAKAIKLNPSLAIAHAATGDIYRHRGDYQRARDSYQEACRANPYAFKPQYNLALTYQKLATAAKSVGRSQEYLAKAIQAYIRAAVLEPDDFDTDINLSACYFQVGKYELAEQYGKAAVALKPDDAHAHGNLGIIYDSQNRLFDAIRQYKAALEIDTHQPKLLFNLASTYMRQNRLKQAIKAFEMAAKLDATDAAPWEQIGACRYRMGDYPAAETAFRKALKLNADSAGAHRGLGVTLMTKYLLDRKDAASRDEALSQWYSSLELDPAQPDLRKFVAKYAPRYDGPKL